MKPLFASLSGIHPRILEELRNHHPILLLLSISLVVGTFADEPMATGLALSAFGTFFLGLLISFYMSLKRPAEARAMGLWNLWLLSYLGVGFLLLGLAGWFLVNRAGNISTLAFLPFWVMMLAVSTVIYWSEFKAASALPRSRATVRFYQGLCAANLVLIPLTVFGAVIASLLDEPERGAVNAVLRDVALPAGLLLMVWFFAYANLRAPSLPGVSEDDGGRPREKGGRRGG